MKALYYPYARSFNRKMLKQAVLLFDEVWFYDPVELADRKEYLSQYSDLTGPAKVELDRWGTILEDYDFLVAKGLVKVFNPKATVDDRKLVRELQLLFDLLESDMRDKRFVKLASHLAGQDYWRISGKRISDIRFLTQAMDRLKPGPRAPKTWDEKSAAHNRSSEGMPGHQMQNFAGLQGNPYSHHAIPVVWGYSLNINRSLLFSEAENLNLLTDDITALRLLNFKYSRAKARVKNFAGPSSIIVKRTPDFFSKYNILAFNVIESLIPSEELDKRTFKEIFRFKRANAEAYGRFRSYLLELTSQVNSEPWSENLEREVLNLIDTKVTPEANNLRNKMFSSYEKMFGSILKKVVAAVSPTLAVSFFSGLTMGQILSLSSAAVAGAFSIAVPELVELWQEERQSKRSGLSFLLKLN